jgi:hypothetical protein
MKWMMACLLPLCAAATGAFGQTVPPGLRACTAESDSGRRLACYDREMARLLTAAAQSEANPPPPRPAPTPPPAAQAPEAAAAPAAAPAATSTVPEAAMASAPPAAAAAPATTASPPAAPEPASHAASAPHHFRWNIFAGGKTSRVTAHIASLDRSPNAMVLHLDNGQVWQQIGRASGDLTLQTGASVTIEKHLGSYYLSSRYVSDMKVRLAAASP